MNWRLNFLLDSVERNHSRISFKFQTQEIEFYEFCKQRLHKQYTAIEARKQISDQESI